MRRTSVRVLFLDIDGVLNRTGYSPRESLGLRSWIEPDLAQRLSALLVATSAEIVLSSDWRRGRELSELRAELAAAGVVATLRGTTPVLGAPRWREIETWLAAETVAPDAFAIVDDAFDMGPLAPRFVRTSPLTGLDQDAADALSRLFEVASNDAAGVMRASAMPAMPQPRSARLGH
ncbi:MAG: HAD domain-containing protein [Kofleriaceae bacterium]